MGGADATPPDPPPRYLYDSQDHLCEKSFKIVLRNLLFFSKKMTNSNISLEDFSYGFLTLITTLQAISDL